MSALTFCGVGSPVLDERHLATCAPAPASCGTICPSCPPGPPGPPGPPSAGGLVGIGSPQGVVTAMAGTPYLDTSANNFWMNKDGTATGWVELIG